MDRINTKEWRNFPFTKWLKFLAEATTTKIRRDFAFIKHEGDTWESTDGHRLHKVISDEIPFIEDGYYEVLKNTKAETILIQTQSQNVKWPSTDHVWPEHKDFVEISGNQLSLYTALVRKLPEGYTVQYPYANCLFDFDEFWTAYIYKDVCGGIKFESGPMHALIMPLSI